MKIIGMEVHMQHNTIPEFVESVSRPTKVMAMSLTDVQKQIDDIRMEAEFYGMRPEKYTVMAIGDVMNEINRRRAQQQPKPKKPERI